MIYYIVLCDFEMLSTVHKGACKETFVIYITHKNYKNIQPQKFEAIQYPRCILTFILDNNTCLCELDSYNMKDTLLNLDYLCIAN